MDNSLDNLALSSIATGYSKYSSSVINPNNEADSGYMDFDSYLKVLQAKLSNQDFNDPMSDSEMLQQMASYSMLEGIKNMTNQSNISYASSLVGKAVTVNDGEDYDTGLVEAVIIQDNKPYLSINGGLYEWNKVTDICDVDIYHKLSSLVGREVEVPSADSDGNTSTLLGTVTNVLFVGGSALVVVDGNNAYPINVIKVRGTNKEESGDNAEDGSTGSAGGAAGTDPNAGVTEDTNIAMENAAAQSDLTAGSYTAQSDALFNELMSTIDAISGNVTETAKASMNNIAYNDIAYAEGQVHVPDYAAGVFASEESVLETLSLSDLSDIPAVDGSKVDPTLGSPSYSSSSSSSSSQNTTSTTSSVSQSYRSSYGTSRAKNPETYVTVTASNFSTIAEQASHSKPRNGRMSNILTNEEAYAAIASGEYTARYSQKNGLELFSETKPGISTSDCVPHRLNASMYPQEAALADSLGTRMYDIKFIHNSAINSRIDTSTVIAQTINGEQATEIGFSGIGQLGEVVTFRDGTQRVEILLKSGSSMWLRTSGNYTIDEICSLNVVPGSLDDLFTDEELTIRHYGIQSKLDAMAGIR